MSNLPFHIVDVFAERQYAGNQLAVVMDAGQLATERMQAIALEMNYSETTFITSPTQRNGGFDVRIFTLKTEVPFAGHPTLGTAWVIARELLGGEVDSVVLNLGVGPIPVTFERPAGEPEVLWMRQRQPEFGETVEPRAMADVLGLAPEDLDTRFPVREVSTGLPFFIVPLRGLEAVRRARAQRDAYDALVARHEAKAVMLFSSETYEGQNQLNARMFADWYGVPEDPATGSAAGCLAAWLVEHRYLGGQSVDVRVEQGYEIGRPSILRLRARPDGTRIDVRVGGRVFASARGKLV